MREAFIKLHLSILLAGFTGIFGKLISLSEGVLVWYRMLIASLMLLAFLWMGKKLHRYKLTRRFLVFRYKKGRMKSRLNSMRPVSHLGLHSALWHLRF